MYIAIRPNNHGYDVSISLIICLRDYGKGLETKALRVTLWIMVERLDMLDPMQQCLTRGQRSVILSQQWSMTTRGV